MLKYLFLIIGILLSMFTSCKQMENELYLFVGTYAEASETGIYVYRFNTKDGTAKWVSEVSNIKNPSYQMLSKDERFLYSVGEAVGPESSVFAYSFDKEKGALSLIGKQVTQSNGPCYVWVDSRRQLAVTANYRGGSISVFPLADDGMPTPVRLYPYEGGTPGSARQDAPHLHCIYASPDEKFLYANDLGTDRIYKYELVTDAAGRLGLQEGQPAWFSLPAGEGPRHTVFHPNGKFAYLIGELSGRVVVLQYENGNLTPVQYIEADSLHAAGSADIRITPDGRFLYASNRLQGDGLAIFSIDTQNGRLTKIGYQPTEIHPRNFVITPDGRFLLCACRDGNVIQVYAINKQTGLLTNTSNDIRVNRPVCLQFAGVKEGHFGLQVAKELESVAKEDILQ